MKHNKIGNILTLSSLNNPLLKKIRKLIGQNSKKNDLNFVAEGEFFLNEAISNNWQVSDLLCNVKIKESFFKNEIGNRVLKMDTNIYFADYKIFQKILKKDNPQDFLFIIRKKENLNPKKIKKNYLSIVLENIKDPGNIGTIFRTAESFGISHCFLLGETANPYSMEVIRASTGASFSLGFSLISMMDLLGWIKKNNINVIGTSPTSSVLHENFMWKTPLLLAIGNEKNGLTDILKSNCNQVLKISTKGKTKSLNAAIASGIFMESIYRKYPNLN